MEDNLISGAKGPLGNSQKQKIEVEKHFSVENFNKYIKNRENFETLKNLAFKCELPATKCRWTLWRVFLKAIPDGSEAEVRKAVKISRDFYKDKLESFINVRSKKVEVDDPLSRGANNPWNSFFEDSDLKVSIRQDVDRTYQDKDFFLQSRVKDILNNILFVWSKLNPTPSYRQGMNELVAVMTWACFHETVEVADEKECNDDYFKFLNNEKYVEADVFTAFTKLMALGQKEMFDNQCPAKSNATLMQMIKPKQKALNLILAGLQADPSKPASAILVRATNIQEYWLEVADEELYRHLKRLHVEPQIYALRWVRCMLSREYSMVDAMLCWDVIFAHYYFNTPKATLLEMLDYMVVAMLQHVRKDLLLKDDGSLCLQRLLRFPPVESITTIIDLALESRDKILRSEAGEPPLPTTTTTTTTTTKVSAPAIKNTSSDFDPLGPLARGPVKSQPVQAQNKSSGSQDNVPIFFSSNTFQKSPHSATPPHTFKAGDFSKNDKSKNDMPHFHTSISTPQLHNKDQNLSTNAQAIAKIKDVIATLEEERNINSEESPNLSYALKELKAAMRLLDDASGKSPQRNGHTPL